mgnify:CR=1 FL=1
MPPSHIRLPLTKMRKPLGIVYAVEDRLPIGVVALSGLQHVALMTTYLVVSTAPSPGDESPRRSRCRGGQT